jgi:hypothetical protein
LFFLIYKFSPLNHHDSILNDGDSLEEFLFI